jgi:6-phosphogluconolactonase
MRMEVLPDGDAASLRGAALIAAEARAAVAARGRFVLAASGGKNPWKMFRALTYEDVPWQKLEILQVDERVAPDGDPDRNLTHLCESLLGHSPLRPEQIHAMPVTDADLEAAAARYAETLVRLAGPGPVIDLVHLGIGPDGHTASLVPNDPVLDVRDRDVALTGVYQNHRRMTLTYPVLNRARNILWLITDETKQDALSRLLKGDPTIPAGRVEADRALVLADAAAAGRPPVS